MGRESRLARLAIAVIAFALTASSTMIGDGTARASTQVRPVVSTSLSIPGNLVSVAATSPTDVWAVGSFGNPSPKPTSPLIVHWNGARWTRVTVPHFPYGELNAVAAVSKNDAWAVGYNETQVPGYLDPPSTLVLHWNGKVWRPVSSLFDSIYIPIALSATATQVWVEAYADGIEFMHYVGGHWYFVPVARQPAQEAGPDTLAMPGPKDGWLGTTVQPNNSSDASLFLMRWDGSTWKHVPFKVSDPYDVINAMAAMPGGAVWAVGQQAADPNNLNTFRAMSLRWDGKAWREVPVNIPGALNFEGVGKIPGGTAWAVGWFYTGSNGNGALIALWTGTAWELAPSLPGFWGDSLQAVVATSASNAWAVGWTFTPAPSNTEVTVILHWNGTTWS